MTHKYKGSSMKNLLILALALLAGCDMPNNHQSNELDSSLTLVNENNHWFKAAAQKVEKNRLIAETIKNHKAAAKNIILFVGDGMSLTTVTASRIFE